MSSHIAVWLDATSDASDPRWIVSLETDDEISETLIVCAAETSAWQAHEAADRIARQRGLPVEESR